MSTVLPPRVLEDIARGAPLDPGAVLAPLRATAFSERASANAELAQALSAAGRAGEAEPFAERALVLSGFSERVLPLYVEIQKALGRIDRVCAAYRRAGMKLADAGRTEEAIGLFSLSHLAFVHAGQGDRYEYDFEIQRAIEVLARAHRPAQEPERAPRGEGAIRLAYLVFGAIHRGSVLVKLLCNFAKYHDRARFDVRFYVPESPRTPRHAPHSEELRTNIALLEAHGARVEAASAASELECWLETDRRIREFGADILVTTALLAHYSHFFIAAMRPARAIVGLGLGPPEQYAAPGLDWVVCATRHPLMDMPCDASVVEFETSPPDRDAIRLAQRSAFDVSEGAPLIVVAGRAQKFLDRNYWAALSQILTENPNAYLLALGLAEEPSFLGEVLAPEVRSRFRRIGWTADYLPLLANADAVIDTYPSGGGFVLTDAMALGIPVVTFRNDYLRPFDQTEWSPGEEFVGVEGLVVPRGDFGKLCRVLGRLIADPEHRREMGRRCRADLLANRSDPGRMVRRHEEIYEAVAKNTAGRKIEPSLARAPVQSSPLERLRRWMSGRPA